MSTKNAIKAEDQYKDHILTAVRATEKGWEIGFDGRGFFCPKSSPVVPQVGSRARLYGKGFGYTVRGLDIDGQEVFYKTVEEHEAEQQERLKAAKLKRRNEYETARKDYDRRVAALPDVFRQRIEKYRKRGNEWRYEFEPYEIFTCEEAVKIAAYCKTAEGVRAFHALPFEEQRKAGVSTDHSGNTFGMACRLAMWFVDKPENVVKEHGALVALVGCKEYGCHS